jgi:hypothetical protein
MKILLILFTAVFLISSSCNNDETIIAIDKGTIMGVARRYNELGQVRQDNDNITVTLKKDTKDIVSAQTGKDGKFTFKEIEPGVYDIICSYPGDDTATVYSYQFSGNGTAWVHESEEMLRIIKPAFTKFQDISVNVSGDSLLLDGTKIDWVSEPGEKFYYRIFLSLSPDVSKEDGKYILSVNASYDASVDKIKYTIPILALYPIFKKSQTVYLVVYPGYSLYFKDNRTDYSYFSGLGQPSAIKSFVMP